MSQSGKGSSYISYSQHKTWALQKDGLQISTACPVDPAHEFPIVWSSTQAIIQKNASVCKSKIFTIP